ncbi:anillin-like [Agrilus planipennis]|uniref:Anillin-like n=1 Tax=Agrilus planipennis TaxID=224129 RepID=A0A1W4X489_AGRPL|nr:anillin-like [Agrilus planipennis]XP_018327626.1 anillin-like [Agrilus planipennis]XP_018327627.1 anillin-like [Agrilus planipennis]
MLTETDPISVSKELVMSDRKVTKTQKVIKVKVLVSKNAKKHEKFDITSVEHLVKYQESIGRPRSCPNRPIMGTTALLTRAKSLNLDVSNVVQKLILDKYQSTLTYFSDRSFARRKTRKRKSTGNVFNSTLASDQSYITAISSHQEMSEPTIGSYDEVQFLKDALGDEIDAYASTLDIKEHENDYSVSTCDISDLVSTPIGSLRSHDSIEYHKSFDSSETYCSTPVPQRKSIAQSEDPRREAILQRLLVQEQIIQQISKVIDFCKNTKQFSSSEEYIEAEKVLLLAIYKKEMLLKDLTDLPETNSSTPLPISGYVCIKRLHFPLKHNPGNGPVKDRKGFSYKYLCVITCGNKILSSDVVGQSRDGTVQFRGNFQLDNLADNFEIRVFLYSLIVKNNLKHYSEQSKYHIAKETVSCPTPAKLFHSPRRHNKSGGYSVNLQTISSFTQWGNFTIKLQDLNKKKTEFQISNVPLRSTLQGIAKVEIHSGVVINKNISGFLNMGSRTNNDTVSWNRLWCKLDGQYLKFWNYPSEEHDNSASTVINLSNSVNYPLSCASREICPRPRTLLLQTHEVKCNGIVIYLLSYDSLKELETWKDYLNSVIVWCKN